MANSNGHERWVAAGTHMCAHTRVPFSLNNSHLSASCHCHVLVLFTLYPYLCPYRVRVLLTSCLIRARFVSQVHDAVYEAITKGWVPAAVSPLCEVSYVVSLPPSPSTTLIYMHICIYYCCQIFPNVIMSYTYNFCFDWDWSCHDVIRLFDNVG